MVELLQLVGEFAASQPGPARTHAEGRLLGYATSIRSLVEEFARAPGVEFRPIPCRFALEDALTQRER